MRPELFITLSEIEEISRKYRLDFHDFLSPLLYLLCLRKITESAEAGQYDTEAVAEIKAMFSAPEPVNIDEALKNSISLFEKKYSVEGEYFTDFFLSDGDRDTPVREATGDFVRILAAAPFSESEYFSFAKQLILMFSKQPYAFEHVSNSTICELLRLAADVREGESVLDGCMGYGHSALACLEGSQGNDFTGYELSLNSCQISTFMFILAGKTDFRIHWQDFASADISRKADKIIMDCPMVEKLSYRPSAGSALLSEKWLNMKDYREAELMFIAHALEAMKDEGRAVLTVPSRVATRRTKPFVKFRNRLLGLRMLKAVVFLPPVYNGSLVNTALLVFEKNCDKVVFINARKFIENKNTRIPRSRNIDTFISDENMKILKSVLDDGTEIFGASAVVPCKAVAKKGDWDVFGFVG